MRQLATLFVLTLSLVSTAFAQSATVGQKESGLAAVYTSRLANHTTASGQRYDPSKLTAAHKTLPFGTKIRVTNPKNKKSVVLRVTDRGPVQNGRILDISSAAAGRLGIPHKVMREVDVEVLEVGSGKTTAQHQE